MLFCLDLGLVLTKKLFFRQTIELRFKVGLRDNIIIS